MSYDIKFPISEKNCQQHNIYLQILSNLIWDKVFDFQNCYNICYKLLQKFLAPYLFGPSEEEKKIVALQKSIAELESNIKEVVAGVTDMKKSVGEQKDDLKQIVLDSAASRVSIKCHCFVS